MRLPRSQGLLENRKSFLAVAGAIDFIAQVFENSEKHFPNFWIVVHQQYFAFASDGGAVIIGFNEFVFIRYG